MAENPNTGDSSTNESSSPAGDRVLLIIIVASPALFDDLVTGLLDIGIAATVVESKGLMALLREEMPIFGGLASMLPENTGSRLVISVTSRSLASKAFDFLTQEVTQADRPIAFTVPIDRVIGMRQ